MQWLLYAVLAYVAACYLGGLYLMLRLTFGGRLRRIVARTFGRRPQRVSLPTVGAAGPFVGSQDAPAAVQTSDTASPPKRQAA